MQQQTGFPSIDKPWMKYYQSKPQPVPACTVWRNIYENNKHDLDGIAIQYFGKKITYKSLFAKVGEAKRAFIAAGVKRGDNVSFLMLSCPEMVYAILALNQLGAVANMVNPTFTPEQMCDRINDSEAHIIIILDQLYERLAAVISDICPEKKIIVPIEQSMPLTVKAAVHFKLKKSIPYSASVISWKQFVASGDPSQPDVPDKYIPDTPAIMVYSSGTTGASKGIVLTNDGINATIRHYTGPDFDYKRGDTFLHMGASWFSTFMIVCLMMPLRMGITVIIEPVFSEKTFVDGIVKNKPTMTLAAVGLWLAFIHSPKAATMDLSGMKYPITGGEKVLPETENEINAFLKERGCQARLLIGYGMCELGSTVVTNSEKNYKQSSAGFPITDVIVSAFDPETNEELPTGQRGEIRVISPCRMKEYYKRPDATAEFFINSAIK